MVQSIKGLQKLHLGRISRSKNIHFFSLTRDKAEVEAVGGCDVGDDVLVALFDDDDVGLEGGNFFNFCWINLCKYFWKYINYKLFWQMPVMYGQRPVIDLLLRKTVTSFIDKMGVNKKSL